MNKKYNLKLDLQFRCNNSTMKFNQFDNNTSDFFMRITNGGNLVDIEKALVVLAVIKPSGKVSSQFVEVENGLVYADLKPNMKDEIGTYTAQAMLILEDERVVTDTISYEVEEDKIFSLLNDTVEVAEEFTLLTDMLNRLSTIEISEEQRVINEAERILSEENRKIEESKRVETELIRQHEEADRTKYEAIRESNENTRKQNESIRLANETNRIDEEAKRVEEENKRKLAEEERNANYNFMTEDEERRRSEANAHKEAENLRVQAETNRVNEEAKRRTTEQARVSAENTRVSNENTREANEITRKNNETQRIEAETQRKNRYNSFISDAEANASNFENYTNTAKAKEEERKANELDRKSQEDRRVSNETERISNENTRKANEVARIESEKQRVDAENLRKEKIIEIQTDYDSLKKVIIDENASANLQNQINQTNSQLEHKANEDEVRKKSVLITETDISDRLKQQINGNAPIMQTIGNKSVTKEKTTFYKNGKNLFNKDAVINGYYINHTNGDILINSIYSTSDYISIDANENYTLSNSQNFRYALYDSEYNFIKGAISSNILTDENSYYIRFSFTGSANNPQLEKGSEASAYEEYYSIIPFTDIEKHSHSINELEGQIREDNTIFFNKSDNLVNKNTCISGFISSSNGELYSHSTYWCTDFIEVETGEYSLTGGLGMAHAACYDINKTYICPVSDFKITSTTINITNDNVKFIRLLVTDKSKLDTIFLYKGLEEKIYTEFGYFLKDEYIKKTDSKSIIINLPSKLYALEGEEFNIYFDNILEGRDTDYIINVDCNVGMQLERCYRLVPTQKGKVDITINVYDKEMNIVGVKTSKIIISSKTQGSGLTKKVIILGDSTTNNGICVTKLNENFSNDEMSITTLGTRGVSPYNHEGRSGWTFRQYFTMQEDTNGNGVVNPFYNPNTKTFDYEYYCNNSGIETTDYFIINLGINDTFNYSSDSSLYTEMENLFAYANEIIRQIHTKDANIKIGIVLTIPPNYSQDAFGKAYNCNQYRDRYKRNNVLWVNELIKKYDNRENENIYLIPLHCNLDTKYNFGLEEIQVNKRNNMTYLSPIGNGGVHPVDSGYWQCADTYWYFLKAQEL